MMPINAFTIDRFHLYALMRFAINKTATEYTAEENKFTYAVNPVSRGHQWDRERRHLLK